MLRILVAPSVTLPARRAQPHCCGRTAKEQPRDRDMNPQCHSGMQWVKFKQLIHRS